ncbi:MAG: hypothetical protein ACFFDN_22105 [Candidatus Hodarchaeota archaeon]
MQKLICILLGTLFIIVFFIFCERVDTFAPSSELKLEKITEQTGIPLEYGKLISITSPQAGRAHLWFEDDNHTIRLVEIIYGSGESGIILKEIRKIDRR